MHASGPRHDALKRRSGPKSKTSCYLGVTQYKRTGRWEAHIWDSGDPEHKKGRQLHLGSFPAAIPAAIAYDRAAHMIKPRNISRNFPATDYSRDEFIMKYGHLSKLEFVSKLRIWAQDPSLAAEYLGYGRRPEKSMTQPPPARHPALQAPLRESRPLAMTKAAPKPPEPVPSPQRPGPSTPLILPPVGRARLPLPVPQPVSRKPRSKRYTCARPNIQPIKSEQSFGSDDDLQELEAASEGGAHSAMVMLLMAMKAADATPATAARPEQQSLKRQSSLPAVAVARRHHETAEENLRRRRHPGVAVSDGYQREESARKLPETGCLPVQPPAPVRPLVAEWTGS